MFPRRRVLLYLLMAMQDILRQTGSDTRLSNLRRPQRNLVTSHQKNVKLQELGRQLGKGPVPRNHSVPIIFMTLGMDMIGRL